MNIERPPAYAVITVARKGIKRDDQLDDGHAIQDHHDRHHRQRQRRAAHEQGVGLEQNHRVVGDDAGDEDWKGGAIPLKP